MLCLLLSLQTGPFPSTPVELLRCSTLARLRSCCPNVLKLQRIHHLGFPQLFLLLATDWSGHILTGWKQIRWKICKTFQARHESGCLERWLGQSFQKTKTELTTSKVRITCVQEPPDPHKLIFFFIQSQPATFRSDYSLVSPKLLSFCGHFGTSLLPRPGHPKSHPPIKSSLSQCH